MTRHLALFLVTFAVGALMAVVARATFHRPYAAALALPPAVVAPAMPAADPHAAAPPPAPAAGPVNTVCAVCGMPVDPRNGTTVHQGKTIGFGCRTCLPTFAADPDRYGPAALANQVVE